MAIDKHRTHKASTASTTEREAPPAPISQRQAVSASALPVEPAANDDAPMVPPTGVPGRMVPVDGWHLADGDGGWVRDIELAEKAGLVKPRNIRSVIEGAAGDGVVAICDNSARTEGAVHGGVIIRVETKAPKGNGSTQPVTEYWLNKEAAVHVLMRLRTPMAIKAQIAVVRVFTLVEEGRLAAHAPQEFGADALAVLIQIRDGLARTDSRLATIEARQDAQDRRHVEIERLLHQHGKHAEFLAASGIIFENSMMRGELKAMLSRWAEIAGRTFASVHGEFIREHKATYLRLQQRAFGDAKDWLRGNIDGCPVKPRRQLTLFQEAPLAKRASVSGKQAAN